MVVESVCEAPVLEWRHPIAAGLEGIGFPLQLGSRCLGNELFLSPRLS